MKIEVTVFVPVYEIEGKVNYGTSIELKSHWNRDDMVVISVHGKTVTVDGQSLISAIKRATR